MSELLCAQCGKNPRMKDSQGRTRTRCNDCQREYWRQSKSNNDYSRRNVVKSQEEIEEAERTEERTCKSCGESKMLSEFYRSGSGWRYTCKACNRGKVGMADAVRKYPTKQIPETPAPVAAPAPPPERISKADPFLVVVEGDTLRLYKPVPTPKRIHNVAKVADFYEHVGYRVIRVKGS